MATSANINQNHSASYSGLQLGINSRNLSKVLQQLSTGNRVNYSKDDASGFSIANKMRTASLGTEQASKNATAALQMSRIADEAVTNMVSSLQRIRVLAQNSINGTNSSSTRSNLNEETQALLESLKGIASGTKYGNLNLLDGQAGPIEFQLGSEVSDKASVNLINANLDQMGTHSTKLTMGGIGAGVVKQNLTVTDANGKERKIAIADNDGADKIAAAFNKAAGADGVKAQAQTNVKLDVSGATINTGNILSISGVDLKLDGITDNQDMLGLINGNAALKNKGISAEIINNELVLNQKDGKTVNLKTDAAGINATYMKTDDITGKLSAQGTAVTLDATGSNVVGDVSLFGAAGEFKLSSDIANGLTGLPNAGDIANSKDGLTLDKIDISTVLGAQLAMHVVDAALDSISKFTSKLGALQARFENSIDLLDSSKAGMDIAIDSIVAANVAELSTLKSGYDQKIFSSYMAISNANNAGMPIYQTLLR